MTMNRVLDKVVSLIAPELKERFLLAFPSEDQPKTRIFFRENIAEIETGTLGFYFSVKSRHSGNGSLRRCRITSCRAAPERDYTFEIFKARRIFHMKSPRGRQMLPARSPNNQNRNCTAA
jgi:hypothetical protein